MRRHQLKNSAFGLEPSQILCDAIGIPAPAALGYLNNGARSAGVSQLKGIAIELSQGMRNRFFAAIS